MAITTWIGATIEIFRTIGPFVPIETVARVIVTISIQARYGGTVVDEVVAMGTVVILITVTGVAISCIFTFPIVA